MSSNKRLFTSGLRTLLFKAIAGGEGDPTGKSDRPEDLVLAAFGRNRRGGPDTAAAAAAAGVSQRSVSRWLRGDRHVNPESLRRLRKAARQAASTKAGRKRTVARAKKPRRAATVTFEGEQGPRDYERMDRQVSIQMSAADIEALRNAYIAGGDKGAVEWMQNWLSINYVAGWNFISIDDLAITL